MHRLKKNSSLSNRLLSLGVEIYGKPQIVRWFKRSTQPSLMACRLSLQLSLPLACLLSACLSHRRLQTLLWLPQRLS